MILGFFFFLIGHSAFSQEKEEKKEKGTGLDYGESVFHHLWVLMPHKE